MSTDPGATLPIADEAREAYEAARREHRDLTETERAIAGAEALTRRRRWPASTRPTRPPARGRR